jgi:hypothetical protein
LDKDPAWVAKLHFRFSALVEVDADSWRYESEL